MRLFQTDPVSQVNSSDYAVPGNWGNCDPTCMLNQNSIQLTRKNSSVSTSPWEFADLCETGQCPAGWNREEESCVINLIGLQESVAREECGKYRGDFSSATQDRFQCKGGANLINI